MASKVPIYNSDGTSSGTVDLPAAFDEPVRIELISRAAISDQSYLYHPKGSDPRAG